MVNWRFWRSRRGDSIPSSDYPLPTVEEAADDGEAMALQAALMSVKNIILVQAITTPEGVEVANFVEPAREVVTDLIKESRESASRIQEDINRAQRLRGEARYRDDYRRGDLGNLTVRRDTLELVADRLSDRLEEKQWLTNLIEKAHAMAWEEISREMERSLDKAEVLEFGDENYELERETRLREFKNINLAELIEQNEPEY